MGKGCKLLWWKVLFLAPVSRVRNGHNIVNRENSEIWKQTDRELMMWWAGYKTELKISKTKWTTIGKLNLFKPLWPKHHSNSYWFIKGKNSLFFPAAGIDNINFKGQYCFLLSNPCYVFPTRTIKTILFYVTQHNICLSGCITWWLLASIFQIRLIFGKLFTVILNKHYYAKDSESKTGISK